MAKWHKINVTKSGSNVLVSINDSKPKLADGHRFTAVVGDKAITMTNLGSPRNLALEKFKVTQNGRIRVKTTQGEFPEDYWKVEQR